MQNQRANFWQDADWLVILLYAVMVILGWLNIYAADFNEEAASIFDFSQNYGKQIVWIGTAAVLAFLVLLVDSKFYDNFAYVLHGFFAFLLLAVLAVGSEIKGSQSWLVIGGISIQPAEFAKYGTSLALAHYYGSQNPDFRQLKTKLYSVLIIGIPVVLIMLQPDPGSTLVYSTFALVLFREGMPGSVLLLALVTVVLFIITLFMELMEIPLPFTEVNVQGEHFLIFIIALLAALILFAFKKRLRYIWKPVILFAIVSIGFVAATNFIFNEVFEDRHRNRVHGLLGIISDPQGTGYNQHQSKIAIGSGGLTGKGYLEGTQTKFKFVPEQSTDFIFCTVGEEWGFLGTTAVILLFLILFWRLIFLAERQRSRFARVFGYCVVSILFFHFAVNIGMTIGLAPVIGIPLPFFSYGGSSLWSFTILLFTFIKLDANRRNVLV